MGLGPYDLDGAETPLFKEDAVVARVLGEQDRNVDDGSDYQELARAVAAPAVASQLDQVRLGGRGMPLTD